MKHLLTSLLFISGIACNSLQTTEEQETALSDFKSYASIALPINSGFGKISQGYMRLTQRNLLFMEGALFFGEEKIGAGLQMTLNWLPIPKVGLFAGLGLGVAAVEFNQRSMRWDNDNSVIPTYYIQKKHTITPYLISSTGFLFESGHFFCVEYTSRIGGKDAVRLLTGFTF